MILWYWRIKMVVLADIWPLNHSPSVLDVTDKKTFPTPQCSAHTMNKLNVSVPLFIILKIANHTVQLEQKTWGIPLNSHINILFKIIADINARLHCLLIIWPGVNLHTPSRLLLNIQCQPVDIWRLQHYYFSPNSTYFWSHVMQALPLS